MIVWKSIINERGVIVAPYNTLLALKVGWNDELLGDLYRIYPVTIIQEYEQDIPGGKVFNYPFVASADDEGNIPPEELGFQHTWCLWDEFVKEARL